MANAGSANADVRLFQLKNNANRFNQCLTPQGGGTTNGTVVTLWDCIPYSSSMNEKYPQLWAWDDKARTLRHVASNKCLTPKGGASGTNGAVLTLWTCDQGGESSQKWAIGDDPRTISTLWGSKCITAKGGSVNPGVWATLWSCNTTGTGSQNWYLE
ncbi:RICIN domain-containing protein [Streptomyces sp. NPDC058471]|uniref:RICIN domain-containing protein n=1 Tax=Streptomyces sp. NPDC058471 TaxID=3346516 RepID=UPI003658B3FA